MKHNVTLVVLSVLSVLFMTLHLADDIVRGMDEGKLPTLFGVLIMGIWLYGALVLAGRRSGYIILLLGALFGLAVLIVHMKGAGVGGIAKTTGGFFFAWTLLALGVTALVSLILSVRGLWSLRRGSPVRSN